MMPRIRPETRRRLIAAGLVIAAFAAMQPLRVSVNRLRSRYELTPPAGELHLGEFVGTVLLGGFRGIAVDLLWIKALDARRTHDWHSLLAINRLIADLQPRFTRVWEFNMWNMTTNLARRAPTSREGWQWLKRGIEFGKEGHRRNPRNWRLAYAIGYEYFYRCGALDDALTRKFQTWLLEETGRSNWQHALEWFTRAWELAGPDADPDCLEMLPETHGRMALEAEARGDHAEMRSQRMQAIDRLEKLAAAYAADEQFAANARRKVADLRGRLQAHELEQQAARLPDGEEKFDLLRTAAAQWKAAYRANPWQTEQIRHLEAIAAQMESMAHGATAAFRSRLDAEILDIWLRLLSGPHRVDEWMEKGDQLDTAWSAKLNDAVAAGDLQLAGRSLEAVAELRMWLFEKEHASSARRGLRSYAPDTQKVRTAGSNCSSGGRNPPGGRPCRGRKPPPSNGDERRWRSRGRCSGTKPTGNGPKGSCAKRASTTRPPSPRPSGRATWSTPRITSSGAGPSGSRYSNAIPAIRKPKIT